MLTEKIKILQVVPDLGIGGLPRVAVDICKNIDKSIFDISVYCFKKCKEEFTAELLENKVSVCIPHQKDNYKPNYLNFFKLYSFMKKGKFDIVHTHNTAAFTDGVVAAKMAGVPITIHTDHARAFPDKVRYMFAERFLSHFTTKIVAVSEYTRNELIKYEKIAPKKIIVIPNGINEREYNFTTKGQKKEELGINGYSPILGLGVRLSEQKGISYLLRAIPLVLQEFPKAMLLIAGGGPLQQELEKEAQGLGISRSVKFLGFRLDMPELLEMLDVYILPSLWEGLPLVILEAMAARKPIVATAIGGTPTAIIHEDSGLLVAPKDPDALAYAILRILKSPGLACYLSENAYKRFRQYFTVQEMVTHYEELYLTHYYNKYYKPYRLYEHNESARV